MNQRHDRHTHLRTTGAVVAALLLVAGCSTDIDPFLPAPQRVNVIEPLELPARAVGTEAGDEIATTLPTTLPSLPEPAERAVSLADVRELALRHNLELAVTRFDPDIAAAELAAERAVFDTLFVADANWAKLDQPIGGRVLDGQLVGSQVEQVNVAPGLVQPLLTGGQLQATTPIQRLETDEGPVYESDLSLRFNQPLARNFGEDANALGIRLAAAGLGQAQIRQKLDVINILSEADRAYWRLYAASQAVEVRQSQFELAVEQLERARRLVDAGEQVQVEVVRAESDVANAYEAVLQTQNLRRDRQRELKRLLNAPDLEIMGQTHLRIESLPSPVAYDLDPALLVNAGLERRMELLESELAIIAETAQVLAARNARLPRIDLNGLWNVNGAGGSFGDTVESTADGNFQDYRLGLSVEVPIGNRQARQRLRAALLRRMQQIATQESRVLQVKQEVLQAADALETAWQRILTARRRVLLQARLLSGQTRQFELGLSTGLEVSQARAELADAQLSEIEALTDYEIARVDLAVATGTVIGKDQVLLEAESPQK